MSCIPDPMCLIGLFSIPGRCIVPLSSITEDRRVYVLRQYVPAVPGIGLQLCITAPIPARDRPPSIQEALSPVLMLFAPEGIAPVEVVPLSIAPEIREDRAVTACLARADRSLEACSGQSGLFYSLIACLLLPK